MTATRGASHDISTRPSSEATRQPPGRQGPAPNDVAFQLRERRKELRALTHLAMVGAHTSDIQSLLDTVVAALEPSFLHHDLHVTATLGPARAASQDPPGREPALEAPLVARGTTGHIRTAYRTAHRAQDHGPYLNEERTLVSAAADMVSAFANRLIAAEHLEKAVARLSEAQALAHLGSWELDLRTDRLWWSKETYRLFGRDPDTFEPSYDAFLDTIPPNDRLMVDRTFNRSVVTRTPYSIEHRLLLADGTVKWVHERGETVYDDDGKPVRSIGTAQDITGRKRAELEVEALRSRYEHLVENAPDALLLVDTDGRIRFTNERITNLFGYERDELDGETVETLVPEGLRNRHVRERQTYMRGPVARPMGAGLDLRARRKDGTTFPVDISLTPLDMPGGLMVMATVRDITDRERTRSASLG